MTAPTRRPPWPAPGAHHPDDDVLTPALLGLDNDPVAHALQHLSRAGDDLTPNQAARLLTGWERHHALTEGERAEVLTYYGGSGQVMHLPPHCPGLTPLTDPALRAVA